MLEIITFVCVGYLVWLFGAVCMGFVALLIQPRYRFDQVNAWSPEQERSRLDQMQTEMDRVLEQLRRGTDEPLQPTPDLT